MPTFRARSSRAFTPERAWSTSGRPQGARRSSRVPRGNRACAPTGAVPLKGGTWCKGEYVRRRLRTLRRPAPLLGRIPPLKILLSTGPAGQSVEEGCDISVGADVSILIEVCRRAGSRHGTGGDHV